MECDRCGNENLTDYGVCPDCAPFAHFTHRAICLCSKCQSADVLAFAGDPATLADLTDDRMQLPLAA